MSLTTSDEILTLVINRNPTIPASVAQELADHLKQQDDRIDWLQHEAQTVRDELGYPVVVHWDGHCTRVHSDETLEDSFRERLWLWWNTPS